MFEANVSMYAGIGREIKPDTLLFKVSGNMQILGKHKIYLILPNFEDLSDK